MNQVKQEDARTPQGCEECLAMGSEWVHLRLCLGCGRTADEIAAWTTSTDLERAHILALLPKRLECLRRQSTAPFDLL